MSIQHINIGQAPNDGTGDQLRSAFGKANANFEELDTRASAAWTRANEGVAAAATAQSTADGAASGVTVAQAAADAAGTAAATAQSTADGAASAAGNAQADATSALTQVSTRAPIANPAFTGIAVAPDIAVSKAGGNSRSLLLRTGADNRWGIEATSAAESGSNAGSALAIRRYSDAGASIDTPLVIDRATGRVALGPGTSGVDPSAALLVNGGIRAGSWFIPGAFTFSTLPTASVALSGAITHCSDAAGGASDVQCNGTEWLSLKTGLPVNVAPYTLNGQWQIWRSPDGGMRQRITFPQTRLAFTTQYGSAWYDNSVDWNANYSPVNYPVPFVKYGTYPSPTAIIRLSAGASYYTVGFPAVLVRRATASNILHWVYNPAQLAASDVEWWIEAEGFWKI